MRGQTEGFVVRSFPAMCAARHEAETIRHLPHRDELRGSGSGEREGPFSGEGSAGPRGIHGLHTPEVIGSRPQAVELRAPTQPGITYRSQESPTVGAGLGA